MRDGTNSLLKTSEKWMLSETSDVFNCQNIFFGFCARNQPPIYSICVSVKDLFLQRTIIRDIAIIAEGIDKLLDKASLTILLEQDLLDSFK